MARKPHVRSRTRAGTAGRRQAFRALKAGAGKEGQGPHFSQGYRRGSERERDRDHLCGSQPLAYMTVMPQDICVQDESSRA